MSQSDTVRASAPDRRRLPSLTGLRFLAALLVFTFHAAYEFPFADAAVGSRYSHWVSKAGQVGVGFFFVLSGFVLVWTARSSDTPTRFWRRRLVKVFPNHAVTWSAAFVLLTATGAAVTAGVAVPNLLLVHAWIPRNTSMFSMDDVSWTLSCEAFFYLCFPLLFRLLSHVPARLLWALAGVVVMLAEIVPLVATTLPDRPLFVDVPTYQVWFTYLLPATRLLDFVLGMIMAQIVRQGRWVRIPASAAVALLALGYWLALDGPRLYGFVGATIVPLALLVPAVATADLQGARSWLASRPLVWLGEVSFAFYLVHRLVLQYGHIALGRGRRWDTVTAVLLLIAALVVSVSVAAVLHRRVEEPMMRRFARARRRTDSATAQVAPLAVTVPAITTLRSQPATTNPEGERR